MLDLQWQRDGERVCERGEREKKRDEIISLKKTSPGKSLKDFL